MRRAEIRYKNELAGWLTQDEEGFHYVYDTHYLVSENPVAVSLTLPLRREPYQSPVLFPFFDGLIPEGWLLTIVETNWKFDPRDRMGLLMACCKDCIGAVGVIPLETETK